MIDTIELSPEAAEGLKKAGLEVYRYNAPQAMAWVALVARELEARPAWFPKGKLATIQVIEAQLNAAAKNKAGELKIEALGQP